MKCQKHPNRTAKLYLIEYTGTREWLCTNCAHDKQTNFGKLQLLPSFGGAS